MVIRVQRRWSKSVVDEAARAQQGKWQPRSDLSGSGALAALLGPEWRTKFEAAELAPCVGGTASQPAGEGAVERCAAQCAVEHERHDDQHAPSGADDGGDQEDSSSDCSSSQRPLARSETTSDCEEGSDDSPEATSAEVAHGTQSARALDPRQEA
jgi:hypothetical protein